MTLVPTMAQCELREREEARRDLAKQRVALFDSGENREVDAVYGALEREIAKNGDPWNPIFRRRLDDFLSTANRLRRRFASDGSTLEATSTDGSAINAIHRPFSDGSGLIEIDLGLLKTTDTLAAPFGDVLASVAGAGGLWSALKATYASQNRQDPIDFAVRVGVVRHALIQRMAPAFGHEDLVFNLSAQAQKYRLGVGHYASEFILAHEVAHHLLGHGKSQAAPHTDANEPGTQCTNSSSLELQADSLALDLITGDGKDRTTGVLGSVLAFKAIDLSERTLFLRNGITHPAVEQREEQALERLDPYQRTLFKRLFLHFDEIIVRSTDFSEALPVSYWKQLHEDASIGKAGLGKSHFEISWRTDKLLSAQSSEWAPLLVEIDKKFGSDLASGLRLLAEGSGRVDALAHWGVKKRTLGRIDQRSEPLSYYDLFQAIKSGIGSKCDIPDANVHEAAIFCANATAPYLASKETA